MEKYDLIVDSILKLKETGFFDCSDSLFNKMFDEFKRKLSSFLSVEENEKKEINELLCPFLHKTKKSLVIEEPYFDDESEIEECIKFLFNLFENLKKLHKDLNYDFLLIEEAKKEKTHLFKINNKKKKDIIFLTFFADKREYRETIVCIEDLFFYSFCDIFNKLLTDRNSKYRLFFLSYDFFNYFSIQLNLKRIFFLLTEEQYNIFQQICYFHKDKFKILSSKDIEKFIEKLYRLHLLDHLENFGIKKLNTCLGVFYEYRDLIRAIPGLTYMRIFTGGPDYPNPPDYDVLLKGIEEISHGELKFDKIKILKSKLSFIFLNKEVSIFLKEEDYYNFIGRNYIQIIEKINELLRNQNSKKLIYISRSSKYDFTDIMFLTKEQFDEIKNIMFLYEL